MKRLLFIFFTILPGTIVIAQLGNYDSNGCVRILTQKTSLAISYKEETIQSDQEAALPVIGSLLAPVIDIGIAAAKEKAKQALAKYQRSFTVMASGAGFWLSKKKLNLPVLCITRKILKKGSTALEDALQITLEPELSPDKTAFRYRVKTPFKFLYSSAKTKKGYDFIDISLAIKFKGLIVNKSQYELKDLRATIINIPMVKPGQSQLPQDDDITSGWLPFPPLPTLELETDVTEEEVKTTTSKGSKEGKPVDDKIVVSTNTLKKKAKDLETLADKSGLFEFEITVTEANPYKIKSENKQKLVEETGEASGKFLKAIVESIFKTDPD